MIRKGTRIVVHKNNEYKNDPSRDVEILTGENKSGKYQQFRAMDVNRGITQKNMTGFLYVRAFTPVQLKVGDIITVKEIIGLLQKPKATILEIKIEETLAGGIEINDEDVNENGTYEY
ncbi:hypothetical protein ACWG0P_14025 [Amedibacillus sp. YH-ame6]